MDRVQAHKILSAIVLVVLGALLAGCGSALAEENLPTAAPTLPAQQTYDLDGAEHIARTFLDAWMAEDYDLMHSLLTFASRDATPLEAFTERYTGVAAEITQERAAYVGTSLGREQSNLAVFTYNLTLNTLILGEFTDENRNLHLVYDTNDNAWRVAWSQDDIFEGMGGGGTLRVERSVPSRANIYDRNGVVMADQNGRMVGLNVIRAEIPAYEACVAQLTLALDAEPTEVTDRLNNAGPNWLNELGVIEPAVWAEQHDALERDCGATFTEKRTRRYPNGTLAPHVVGYVGYPSEAEVDAIRAEGFPQDHILGRSGIEATWNDALSGQPGGRLLVMQGNEVARIITENPARPSESVWLTIDSGLQAHVLETFTRYYANATESWAPRSKGAAAVVFDVRTGAVLAMVSYPTFDANAFAPFPAIGRDAAQAAVETVQRNPRTPELNRATQGLYPSGSTMKTATALAVVDSGVYEPDRRYTCIGTWNREPNFTRFDWKPDGHGTLSVTGAVAQSCNPYFYEAGYNMDIADPYLLPGYFNRFGLGVPTGLTDLPENPGLIANPDYVREVYGLSWSFSRSVNMAIGQDIDVTPLQMGRLASLLANEGTLYRPQLVSHVGLIGEEPSYTLEPDVLDQITLRQEAWDVVQTGMCAVTTERYGTAEFQFRDSPLQRLTICGKTGTAQAPGDGVPPHAWFIAYGPEETPRYATVVVVENAGEGSAVAAPITRDIMEYIFFEMEP